MGSRFFIFVTDNTPYVPMGMRAAESFKEFGLRVEVVKIAKTISWMGSCLVRSIELAAMAERYQGDAVGLLDADLTCINEPVRLKKIEGDVAVHDLGLTNPQYLNDTASRYSAGVILFNASARGRDCLYDWAKRCKADERSAMILREQVYLYEAIEGIKKNGGVVQNLGQHYNQPVGTETVIVHHVASRRLREKMGGSM